MSMMSAKSKGWAARLLENWGTSRLSPGFRTLELTPPSPNGRSPQLRDLEIINVIKKPEKYAPQLTNVDVDKPEMMTTADTKSPLRAGQEYVFLLQVHNTPEIGWIALYPCGALSLNDASLAMVREAATNGGD